MVTIFGVFLICRLMQGDMTARKELEIWMYKRRGHWSQSFKKQ